MGPLWDCIAGFIEVNGKQMKKLTKTWQIYTVRLLAKKCPQKMKDHTSLMIDRADDIVIGPGLTDLSCYSDDMLPPYLFRAWICQEHCTFKLKS